MSLWTQAFTETVHKALIQAERHHKTLALLLIDPDKKAISASLLKELSEGFKASLRAGDTLAFLENASFAVLLTDLEQPILAATVADKLFKACDLPFTLSIAVVIFPEDGKNLAELQQAANDILLQIKKQGGNRYQFATVEQTTQAQDFIKLQADLHQALEKNEFILYYQPKLDLKTKRLAGVEALIRWNHPVYGLIDPFQFIPSAEETNLIIRIGEWTLKEACRTNKSWQEEGYRPITVTVNLSSKQFYQPQLSKRIEKILQETALDPRYLELEIIETTILNKSPEVKQILHSLKSLGLSLALDDFGTGHTSLTYLRDFPISTVKIDQSFIKPLPTDTKNAAITQAMIALAHQLGLRVVAEGVETAEQLQFLSKLNCDEIQGYWFSQPLPASELRVLFSQLPLSL